MNLTLAQLNSDLSRIHAHGLAETNVTEIQHTPGGGVYFTVETTELEIQLAHASAELAKAQRALQSALDRNDALKDYIHDLERK